MEGDNEMEENTKERNEEKGSDRVREGKKESEELRTSDEDAFEIRTSGGNDGQSNVGYIMAIGDPKTLQTRST